MKEEPEDILWNPKDVILKREQERRLKEEVDEMIRQEKARVIPYTSTFIPYDKIDAFKYGHTYVTNDEYVDFSESKKLQGDQKYKRIPPRRPPPVN